MTPLSPNLTGANPRPNSTPRISLSKPRKKRRPCARNWTKAQIFAELARENSTDGAATNGGSLGWFGLGAMVPEFEEAVTTMEVGEVKGPLQTQFGWHLVVLNDTRMSTAPELDEVRDALVQNIQREAVEAEIARVTETAEITRNMDEIAPETLENAGRAGPTVDSGRGFAERVTLGTDRRPLRGPAFSWGCRWARRKS